MPTFLTAIVDWLRDRFDPIVYAPEALISIMSVTPVDNYRLRLTFSNGDTGVIDLERHVQFIGTLAPLRDPTFFQQALIDHGTLCWPGDIDLDPIVIHHLTMGIPIDLVRPELAPSSVGESSTTGKTPVATH